MVILKYLPATFLENFFKIFSGISLVFLQNSPKIHPKNFKIFQHFHQNSFKLFQFSKMFSKIPKKFQIFSKILRKIIITVSWKFLKHYSKISQQLTQLFFKSFQSFKGISTKILQKFLKNLNFQINILKFFTLLLTEKFCRYPILRIF